MGKKIINSLHYYIVLSILIVITLIGGIITVANEELGIKIAMIGTILCGILLLSVPFGLLITYAISSIQKEKISYKIYGFLALFSVVLIIVGLIIVFLGSPFDNKYNVDKVKVLKVERNTITIDYTNYNMGDFRAYVIHKPIYVMVKENDDILVRYPKDNPERMYLVIDSKVGLSMFIVGFIILFLPMELLPFLAVYHAIVDNKKNRKKGKKYGK